VHYCNPQVVPEFVTKIIQVFDCKVARHGNMIVGRTGMVVFQSVMSV
jgi:hypothetical protein